MVLTGPGASGTRSVAGRVRSGGRFAILTLAMIVTLCYEEAGCSGCFVCAQGSVVGVPLR